MRRRVARQVVAAAVLATLAAGCGSAARSAPDPSSTTNPVASPDTAATSTTSTPRTTSTTTTRTAATSKKGSTTTLARRSPKTGAPVAQRGWSIVDATSKAILVDTRTYHLPDGASVTLVRFHAGTYRLDFHLGSQDPPSSGFPVTAIDGDAISAAERPSLIGAFNGGFETSTGSGGVELDGHVLVPLVTGDASLVVYSNGTAQVGAWGEGVPAKGKTVVSVRQNLTPLISNGVVSSQVADVAAWGAELYGVPGTARSAVGIDPSGNLVYAASMAALPVDLATALRDAGVTNAMELDINPYWIQGDVTSRPGGALMAAIPAQQRPADTYLSGWTRDFYAVLASGSGR